MTQIGLAVKRTSTGVRIGAYDQSYAVNGSAPILYIDYTDEQILELILKLTTLLNSPRPSE